MQVAAMLAAQPSGILAGVPVAPLRVAIIGAGPAAFYAAEALLKQTQLPVDVDMFDRLPTPYGLVRHGVAPDHQKIKKVAVGFAAVAEHAAFRFLGNVEFGRDITFDDIREHYHIVLFATGAQTDRQLDIPGEDLPGSHSATAFVAWYNGHPDCRDLDFDLSVERAVIIGVGNVALDVARILCRTPRELEQTDIAPHAIRALSQSRVREVHVIGRRGPAQASFTNPELKELGELEDTDVIVPASEAELDPLSEQDLAVTGDRTRRRKVELIASYAAREPRARGKRLYLRFLLSPTELIAGENGSVAAVRFVRNQLERNEAGTLSARPTGSEEVLAAGLVFRSVGYRGVPLPGVPFRADHGVIPNQDGRVVDPDTSEPLPGVFAAGWIKRGPSGVIGTNKPDAVQTVAAMLEDARNGITLGSAASDSASVDRLLRERGCTPVTFADWKRLDQIEVERGQELGRPRVKFTSVQEMLDALAK